MTRGSNNENTQKCAPTPCSQPRQTTTVKTLKMMSKAKVVNFKQTKTTVCKATTPTHTHISISMCGSPFGGYGKLNK